MHWDIIIPLCILAGLGLMIWRLDKETPEEKTEKLPKEPVPAVDDCDLHQ